MAMRNKEEHFLVRKKVGNYAKLPSRERFGRGREERERA